MLFFNVEFLKRAFACVIENGFKNGFSKVKLNSLGVAWRVVHRSVAHRASTMASSQKRIRAKPSEFALDLNHRAAGSGEIPPPCNYNGVKLQLGQRAFRQDGNNGRLLHFQIDT